MAIEEEKNKNIYFVRTKYYFEILFRTKYYFMRTKYYLVCTKSVFRGHDIMP